MVQRFIDWIHGASRVIALRQAQPKQEAALSHLGNPAGSAGPGGRNVHAHNAASGEVSSTRLLTLRRRRIAAKTSNGNNWLALRSVFV